MFIEGLMPISLITFVVGQDSAAQRGEKQPIVRGCAAGLYFGDGRRCFQTAGGGHSGLLQDLLPLSAGRVLQRLYFFLFPPSFVAVGTVCADCPVCRLCQLQHLHARGRRGEARGGGVYRFPVLSSRPM